VNRNNPLVSAIVSTYNSEKFFRGKIEDLLNQTIIDSLEIIVINSGSRQNEDVVIQEYLKNYQFIKYIHTEERETIYKAWNRGIKVANGKYITNSNTDDRLKRDALERLAEELEKNNEVGLVYANQYISSIPNQKYDEIKINKLWKIPEFDYFVQLDRCVVLSQPMWRAALHFDKELWFNEKLEICGDHEFILNLLKYYKIKYLPIALGVFYVDKNNSNKSLQNMKALETEKLNMTKDYIVDFINGLDQSELISLKDKLEFSVKIPVPILRGKNIIQKYFFPKKHPFTSEFIYYVMALIYIRMGQFKEAIYYCTKIIKTKNSNRIHNLLEKLSTRTNEDIANK
jgi:glycosyltransferase involved in cell wall biosynthesis